MGRSRAARERNHLRLVVRSEPAGLPPVLTDPRARAEFEKLTQALLDAAIEIMDLADGDTDAEPSSDELEEDDGI